MDQKPDGSTEWLLWLGSDPGIGGAQFWMDDTRPLASLGVRVEDESGSRVGGRILYRDAEEIASGRFCGEVRFEDPTLLPPNYAPDELLVKADGPRDGARDCAGSAPGYGTRGTVTVTWSTFDVR